MSTTIEPKDQTKRKNSIAILEARISRADALILELQIQLDQHRNNQVNRLAELRCQKLMLHFQERAAAKATQAV